MQFMYLFSCVIMSNILYNQGVRNLISKASKTTKQFLMLSQGLTPEGLIMFFALQKQQHRW